MFFSQIDDVSQLKRLNAFVGRQLECAKLNSEKDRIHTSTKSYYEIKCNFQQSLYFINFDKLSLDQKKKFICILTKRDLVTINTWSVEDIELEFLRLASKEVSELEEDLQEAFS